MHRLWGITVMRMQIFLNIIPLYAGMPRPVDSTQELQQLITYTQLPLFLIFSAPWCHACNTIKKPLALLMEDPLLKEHITFVTVNFDSAQELCKNYKVDRIPTFVYLKDGKEIARDIGAKQGADSSFFKQRLHEVFQIAPKEQKMAAAFPPVRSIVSSAVVSSLSYLRDGLNWCIECLTL